MNALAHREQSYRDHNVEPSLKRRRLNDREQDEHKQPNDLSISPSGQSQSRYGDVNASGEARTIVGDQHNHYYYASQSTQNDTKRLINSLGFVRMDARQQNIATALPKTCQWVFRHPDFKSWSSEAELEEQNKFLWIKGKPGCGKSTIIKAALKWAEKNKTKRKWVVVSYFFNARAPGELEKSTIGLYRSLVHQILKLVPSFVPHLEELFSSKLMSPEIEWTVTELQEFLKDFAASEERPQFCLFIDALDEGEIADIRNLINFLEDLIDHAEDHQPWRICLSSRHYPHITIRRGVPVIVEDQRDHDRDIELYVRKKLNKDTTSTDLINLQQAICSRSAGIFLWVVLVLPQLNDRFDKAEPIGQLIKHIEGLPKDLEGLFAEILARDRDQMTDCISLFQWVLFAQRSLNATELYLAIQHSRCRSDDEVTKILDDTALQRYLTHHSRGLIEVTKSQPPVMQFIHETVRKFLISNGGLARVDPALKNDVTGWSHAKLFQACLSYFTFTYNNAYGILQHFVQRDCVFVTGNPDHTHSGRLLIVETLPFLEYVSDYLLHHMDISLRQQTSRSDCWQIMIQGDIYVNRVLRYIQCLFEKFDIRRHHWDVTVLYVAAEKQLYNIVKACIEHGNMVNTRCGRYGDALRAACQAGNLDIVRHLVENGANLNSYVKGYDGWCHPLLIAFRIRHLQLAEYLVGCGVSIVWDTILNILLFTDNIPPSFEQLIATQVTQLNSRAAVINDVLCLAAYRGLHGVCEVLLNHGANGNALNESIISTTETKGMYITTPLIAAVTGGHETIVTLLCDSGASIATVGRCCPWNATSRTPYDLPLFQSIRAKRLDLVEILLKRGAEIKKVAFNRSCALSVACSIGNAEIVKLLLSYGATLPDEYSDELSFPEGGVDNDEILEALSRKGINLDGPLYYAAGGDCSETVKKLLELGANADPPIREDIYRTPFGRALVEGKPENVRLLLDAGATTMFEFDFMMHTDYHTAIDWKSNSENVITWLQMHDFFTQVQIVQECVERQNWKMINELILSYGS